MTFLLTGCAGLGAPRNQQVSFNTPEVPLVNNRELNAINEENELSDKVSSIDRKIKSVQENYNAVQNSLVGISGKVADFKTDIDKIAELNTEITALKGDIKLQSQIISNIKNEVSAQVSAQLKSEINSNMQNEINGIKAQVQSEMNGIKTNINDNSNLPLSFMVVFGAVCFFTIAGFVVVIMQNNSQRKELKALKETTPVILPKK